jgi:hypothetical protein
MVVADETHSLQITGNGDVLEPHDGIIGAPPSPSVRQCCGAFLTPTRLDAHAQPSARAGRTRWLPRAR